MSTARSAWEDPRFQLVCRCLVEAGGIPGVPDANSLPVLLGGMRQALAVWLPPGDELRVCERLAEWAATESGAAVELIAVGGDARVTSALEALTTGDRAVGVAHLADDGSLTTRRLDAALRDALQSRLAQPVPPARPVDAVTAELDAARARGGERLAALQRFQRTMGTGRPTATWALIAANVAVFGLQALWGDTVATLVRMGACVDERVRGGEAWRLLSYAMLHAGVQHLLFNMVSLASLGAFYERLLGRGRFLTAYVLAAAGGGLAAVLAGRSSVMVGASGAIFGLIGVAAAVALRPGDLLPPDLRANYQRSVGVNIALQVVNSMLPQVSFAAHAGGAVVGFALMITGVLRPKGEARDPVAWRVAGYALAALMLASSAVAMSAGRPWESPRSQYERALE